MTTKAKSIAAADLAKLTSAAVKKVGGTGRLIRGPLIWGYVLAEANAAKQLAMATAITKELSAGAKAAGFTGLKAIGPYGRAAAGDVSERAAGDERSPADRRRDL